MIKRHLLTVGFTLLVAVPVTIFLTRSSTADNRGIILNVDQNGPEHVSNYHALLRRTGLVTTTDTLGGSLYLFLDKSDLMKAFNEHNSNNGQRDSIVGFIVHYGFVGDTLEPAKGKLIPYIRPLLMDVNGKRHFYNEEAYEYLPNGCPSRCDIGMPKSLLGKDAGQRVGDKNEGDK